MKNITFYTIHQAPHNTFMFNDLSDNYLINVYFLKKKLANYNWTANEFYYKGENVYYNKTFIDYIKAALKSDLCIISGWQSYKYIILIIVLFLSNKKWGLYLDLDINSLKKYGIIKKNILKNTPYIFITGIYGQKFLTRYLKKEEVFNFPYSVMNDKIIKTEIENEIQTVYNVFISNRFIQRKGYHLIIFLINELKISNKLNRFKFSIAGDGLLFESVKNEINKVSDSINFLGWIEYEEYRIRMKNCDIYMHCSEFEPYGIPPIDAFINNKIIVASNKVYSIYDIISFGGQVFMFDYNKPCELYNIFINILEEKPKLKLLNSEIQHRKYPFREIYREALNKIF